jgi:polysaccharide biosynthesis transport protein
MNDATFPVPAAGRTNPLRSLGAVPTDQPQETPLLTRYLQIALRRKWVIIASVFGALVLGALITLFMTRQFTASATIEIARESNKVVQIEGVEQEASATDLEFYQTQYGLLQSRTLAESVARQLKLAEDPSFFEMFGRPTDELFDDISRRPSAAERQKRLRIAGEILLKNIRIEPLRLSRLVYVRFTSPNPELSAKIVNTWTATFIRSNLERRFEATSYARRFLEDRLAQLRQRLEESERALVAYASQQRIINIPSSGGGGATVERSIIAEDLATLNNELAKATADRIRIQARVNEAGGRGATTPEALSNVGISQLRQKRAELAAEQERLLSQFQPDYPPARAVAAQLAQLDRSIAREEGRVGSSFVTSYREALAREQNLLRRVNELKGGVLDLRRRSIQYNIFQREVDTNRALYDGLLQRYKEIGVAGGVGTNNVSIVDAADVPNRPSSPILIINMLLATVAGLAIGALIVFLLEQSDQALSDPREVERRLHIPLLGTIPKTVDQTTYEAMQDRKSMLVEAYLSVQTNLEFSTTHGVPRSLSVASTRQAEGKSTTAFALATSIARAHRRVVLVDGDMRSPSVHGLLKLSNAKGLSNYLAGSDDIAPLLQTVDEFGFSAIAAGPTPPNAAELLTGDRLRRLIDELSKQFDHVVIDSPPVLGLADAILIGSRTEGVVFAVESHGIAVTDVQVALARLRDAGVNVIGAVLTKFESQKAAYGYGYDYGYGYGGRDTAPTA